MPFSSEAYEGLIDQPQSRHRTRATLDIAYLLGRSHRLPSGCLVWTGTKSRAGYGQVRCDGRTEYLHRLSWKIAYGDIPRGMEVCHDCPGGDNPACWEPKHLFLGTHLENMSDARAKGRLAGFRASPEQLPRGEHHYLARLTDERVREIRWLRSSGASLDAIARRMGVHVRTVHDVVQGVTWKHVQGLCLSEATGAPPDVATKGIRRGVQCRQSRLTDERVRAIRQWHASGDSQRAIADRLGVHFVTVSDVVRGVTWKHVEETDVHA